MEASPGKDVREAISNLFLSLNEKFKDLQSGESDGCVTLNGTNVGANMIIHPSNVHDSNGCYHINIYANNNVQGVNNSILLGSQVSMRDPGACLYLPSSYNRYRKRRGPLFQKSKLVKEEDKKMKTKNALWSIPILGIVCLFFVIVYLLAI